MADKLLCVDGTVAQFEASEQSSLTMDGALPPSEINDIDESIESIIVDFAASSDGRGFSMASHLRSHCGFKGSIYASGQLIPDQVVLAFRCGFDGIIVSQTQWQDYGEKSWMESLKPEVTMLYVDSSPRSVPDIWTARLGAIGDVQS